MMMAASLKMSTYRKQPIASYRGAFKPCCSQQWCAETGLSNGGAKVGVHTNQIQQRLFFDLVQEPLQTPVNAFVKKSCCIQSTTENFVLLISAKYPPANDCS